MLTASNRTGNHYMTKLLPSTSMEQENTRERLLTRLDLCERWRTSRETLKRREKAGILTALRLGRFVRYRLRDVERIEKESEVVRP